MAALASAAASGLLAPDAAAQVARRRDDDDAPPTLVVVAPAPRILLAGHGSHRSHSSHSSSSGGGGAGHSSHTSHRSHYSSSGGAGRGDSVGNFTDDSPASVDPIVVEKPPPPPKPARMSIVAFPGGQIFLDGKLVGRDITDQLVLQPGAHTIKILNRFIGEHSKSVNVADGETGVITITW